MKAVSQELFEYAVSVFRDLHRHPEVGFDLPNTTALVKKELENMGIPYTTQYGESSIVGYIGNREDVPTIALRADMDALPVLEKVDLPYKSEKEGFMHACGHDSHTAILLASAKALKAREAELPCNVRLFFQPSEEGAISGARMMVDNGCMDGVDAIACTHCEPELDAGTLGVLAGDYMAACIPITLRFYGISSHATLPENGVDAVAMAVEAYGKLKEMVKQEAAGQPYIWSVGYFAGGEVHNIIPDLCTEYISFRFYDVDFAHRVMEKAKQICGDVAAAYGGKYELEGVMSTGPVHNDAVVVERFRKALENVPPLKFADITPRKYSEDFAWYLGKAPGMLFRFGIRNAEKGCGAALHRPDFCVDEEGMRPAILAFVNFVLNYQ